MSDKGIFDTGHKDVDLSGRSSTSNPLFGSDLVEFLSTFRDNNREYILSKPKNERRGISKERLHDQKLPVEIAEIIWPDLDDDDTSKDVTATFSGDPLSFKFGSSSDTEGYTYQVNGSEVVITTPTNTTFATVKAYVETGLEGVDSMITDTLERLEMPR